MLALLYNDEMYSFDVHDKIEAPVWKNKSRAKIGWKEREYIRPKMPNFRDSVRGFEKASRDILEIVIERRK